MDWLTNLFSGNSGKNSTTTTSNDIRQLPDYAEATGARQNWWDTLQKWGSQPGYGAIGPDWNSIWDNASKKVNQYFGGGPQGPGLNASVKANLARRGMSEQPAAETLLQRSGFQQGNQLQDLAVNQAVQQAQFGETGRENWLTSLMNLAGQKPSFSNFGTTSDVSYQQPNPLTGAGTALLKNPGGASDLLGQVSKLFGGGDIMSVISGLFGGGNSEPANIGGVSDAGNSKDSGGFDWMKLLQTLGPLAASFI